MITINGVSTDVDDISIAAYLATTDYDLKRVAIELNGDIVPKAKLNETILHNGDHLEIVSFVGGG